MPFFIICNTSRVSLECIREVSAQNTPRIIYYNFENAYFEWKQKHAVLEHVSLNAN